MPFNEYSFLKTYRDLALQKSNPFELRSLYKNLRRRAVNIEQLEKWFQNEDPESLDLVLAIDATAHVLHQSETDILQKIFPGADINLVKAELDTLAGLEVDNEIRKANRGYFTTLRSEDWGNLIWLEKADQQVGRTTKDAIIPAIKEYEKLFDANVASDGEVLTLSRFYPDDFRYKKELSRRSLIDEDSEPMVVGGPASVQMIDKEGHLITMSAMSNAFNDFMKNFRTRNIMLEHCLAPETKVYAHKVGQKLWKYYPISEINSGDRVLTHAGVFNSVVSTLAHSNHDGQLVVLTLGNKEKIQLTLDHKVLTTSGWKEARALTTEDVLFAPEIPQSIASRIAASHKKNKTLEELYGSEKAQQMKAKVSLANSGRPSNRKGVTSQMKGRTLQEMYGEVYAKARSQALSVRNRLLRPLQGKNDADKRRGKTWVAVYGHPRPQYKDMSGENNPNWRGGISKGEYAFSFTNKLKWYIRKRDNLICQLCGKTQEQEYTDFYRPLSIHHIDYDKKNSSDANLITTCCRCNSKVNFNRDYYTNLFKGKVQTLITNGTAIKRIEIIPYDGLVYNLQIAEYPSFAGRGIIFHNSDFQTGWPLPAYINKNGDAFKSGVDDTKLWLISEIRKDGDIAQKVIQKIKEGEYQSYSIAGSAKKTQEIMKGARKVLQVDELQLSEITLCSRGVNQGAHFDILKSQTAVAITNEEFTNFMKSSSLQMPIYSVVLSLEDDNRLVILSDKETKMTDYLKMQLQKAFPNATIDVEDEYHLKSFVPVAKTIVHPFFDVKKLEKQDAGFAGTVATSSDPGFFTPTFGDNREKRKQGAQDKSMNELQLFKDWLDGVGRKEKHEKLLQEYGFPREYEEDELDESVSINDVPEPWTVNEAGEEYDEEELDDLEDKKEDEYDWK